MRATGRKSRRPSRAFTVLETTLSVALLAVAMTTTVQILGWVAYQRRSVERRECAIQEVANLMEHLATEPWERVTAQSTAKSSLSGEARRKLPGAELAIDVAETDPGLGEKRLSIRLRWRNRAGDWDAPVRLTAYINKREDAR